MKNLPLSPSQQQNYENNIPQFNLPIPFEDFQEPTQTFPTFQQVSNEELRISWENLIGSSSFSSFFNPDDALFQRGPSVENFSINSQFDWNEFQNTLQGENSSISPQTPLQIPGSHSSLQSGSSSSYHSTVAGIPSSQFAGLKIFPVWQNSNLPIMIEEEQESTVLGKRKFEGLDEVLKMAEKNNENLMKEKVPGCPGPLIEEENGSQTPHNQITKLSGPEIKKEVFTKVEPVEHGEPKEKGMASQPTQIGNLSPGINLAISLPLPTETFKPAENKNLGPPRRAAGRPPKPKRVIVQALLCEKKRKIDELEPLLEDFINEITLDLHKWVSKKRQEILQKFKKFKYRAIFGEDGLDTGPNQSPAAP